MPSALESPPVRPESPERAPHAGGPAAPPDEGGDGGGGGDGDSHESGPPISPEKVGVIVFIVFVTMLFAGCLSAYSVIRISTKPWPPPGFPPLPRGLWGSTAVIVASSAALLWAARAARLGRPAPARAGLGATTLLGFAFLALQVLLWRRSLLAGLPIAGTIYGAFFY
ncbi:MAG: cytochrome c oxidase subunit 3, partial [Planctomycetales bacterium]|nr:cytochrome c oxidase subunit 3 [Planctomycetales bacterium]